MNTREWAKILEGLWHAGRPKPATVRELNAFERQHKFKLPKSYRSFCSVFGAACFPGLVDIFVPGGKRTAYGDRDLGRLHENLRKQTTDWNNRRFTPRVQRAIYFGSSENGEWFFWDPLHVTDEATPEYAVYGLESIDGKVRKVANSFSDFILDCVLGRHCQRIFGTWAERKVVTI